MSFSYGRLILNLINYYYYFIYISLSTHPLSSFLKTPSGSLPFAPLMLFSLLSLVALLPLLLLLFSFLSIFLNSQMTHSLNFLPNSSKCKVNFNNKNSHFSFLFISFFSFLLVLFLPFLTPTTYRHQKVVGRSLLATRRRW